MKRWIAFLTAIVLALCTAGCAVASHRPPEGKMLAIYYARDAAQAAGGDILTTVRVSWKEQAGKPVGQQRHALHRHIADAHQAAVALAARAVGGDHRRARVPPGDAAVRLHAGHGGVGALPVQRAVRALCSA
jgi:hypothetical protein